MVALNEQGLDQLLEPQDRLCVSIYLPTARGGPETRQGRVRLRNLLDIAEERLVQCGMRRPDARDLLQPAADLIDNSEFWQHQAEGLALWLSDGQQSWSSIPHGVEELVLIGHYFHITPLLPLLDEDRRFYVLALSKNAVRMLRCSRDTAEEIQVPGAIINFDELDKFIDTDRNLQFHTEAASHQPGQRREAVMHGHGAAADNRQVKRWLNDYAHMVEKSVTAFLGGDNAPLLLAATQPLEGIYRQANTYPHLLDAAVDGAPDHLRAEQIKDKAWPLVQPLFTSDRERALEAYNIATGHQAASSELSELLPAALDGRIATLLLSSDDHCWGRWIVENRQVEVHNVAEPPDEDLLNIAAVLTCRTGGEVYVLPQQQMPQAAPAAAVFRY